MMSNVLIVSRSTMLAVSSSTCRQLLLPQSHYHLFKKCVVLQDNLMPAAPRYDSLSCRVNPVQFTCHRKTGYPSSSVNFCSVSVVMPGQVSSKSGHLAHRSPLYRSYSTEQGRKFNAQEIDANEITPVSSKEIKDFLKDHSLSHHDGYTCYITTCPRHSRKRLKITAMENLFINKTTGYFVCNKCKNYGSWNTFRSNTDNIMDAVKTHRKIPLSCESGQDSAHHVKNVLRAQEYYEKSTPIAEVEEGQLEQLMVQHGMENLFHLSTLSKFLVRVSEDGSSFVFPAYDISGNIAGVRITTQQSYLVQTDVRKRIVSQSIPRLGQQGLFGWHLVKSSHEVVVLTASEWDAMVVHQSTSYPVLAMPKGDSILPQMVLPLLEQFGKVILWFGGDLKTWESAKHFSRKLNDSRCFVIRPGEQHPSPMKAVSRNLNVPEIIQGAKSVHHKSITSFRHLRQEVYNELAEADVMAGVKWNKYPQLNKLLKGHRRGELTVFTGPTGSGKTTFISDYSLDLAESGVNTLWGSFEINNVKLMKTMLTQFAQINLVKHLDQFNTFADRFQELPLHFMTFYGQEQIRTVIETMSHAVYVHDIAHVIVDNLQFMIGLERGTRKVPSDRYLHQDIVIAAFRKFATHMNCHVTLVIHPRKEKESDDLTVSSIFGSAKASQEADNVIILQDKRLVSPKGRKYIQVAKNRYDGELGVMLLKFDPDTRSFATKSSTQNTTSSDKKGDNNENS